MCIHYFFPFLALALFARSFKSTLIYLLNRNISLHIESRPESTAWSLAPRNVAHRVAYFIDNNAAGAKVVAVQTSDLDRTFSTAWRKKYDFHEFGSQLLP